MKCIAKGKALPFILTGLIILVDQGIKSYIAVNWPRPGTLIKDLLGGFLQIYHVRNKAIAFSLGHNIPDQIKPVLFIVLPVIVLGFLLWYYLKSEEFTGIQRWAVAGIIGGGAGNIIDRIFRPEGVVDFISIKFYGFLGLERWPTFNIADTSVVISCIILFLSIMINPKPQENKAAS
jgi:signal peptidase II